MTPQMTSAVSAAIFMVGLMSMLMLNFGRRKLSFGAGLKACFGTSGFLDVIRHLSWLQFSIFVVVCGLAIGWTSLVPSGGNLAAGVCLAETRACPDGTYVTRSGPTCAFPICGGSSPIDDTATVVEDPNIATPAQPAEDMDAKVDIGLNPADFANAPAVINIYECSLGFRAKGSSGKGNVYMQVTGTQKDHCTVKAVYLDTTGGASYACSVAQLPGKNEANYSKEFDVKRFEGMRDKYCIANSAEALVLLRYAASQGDAIAEFNMGAYYDQRHGITADYPAAAKWYGKAADQGYVDAYVRLGQFYNMGLGFKQDFVKAVEWFKKAADKENVEASYSLGVLYDMGQGVKQDSPEALRLYQFAASHGNPEAQARLGDVYAAGRGVVKDPDRAYVWYDIAAGSGIADYINKRDQAAKYVTPGMLNNLQKKAADWHPIGYVAKPVTPPRPVPTPPKIKVVAPPPPAPPPSPSSPPKGPVAVEMPVMPVPVVEPVKHLPSNPVALEAMAGEGDARAQFAVGLLYDQGRGVEKNYAKAAEWYKKAAEQGNVNAKFTLGLLYAAGNGVPKDIEKASDFYGQAADLGVVNAQFQLALLYMSGKGVTQNYAKAVKWFTRAAKQGNDYAQYYLATILLNGTPDVPRNRLDAYFWLLLSSASPNAAMNFERGKLRDNVERMLNKDEILGTKRRATEWQPEPEVVHY